MKYVVIIDDGHGMETPGKRTPKFPDGTFMHENEFNQDVVNKLTKRVAKRPNFEIHHTTEDDGTNPSLHERTITERQVYLKYKKEIGMGKVKILFLSVHANGLKGRWGDWGGIETYHNPGSILGERYAKIFQEELMKGTPLSNRGVKSKGFYLLKYTYSPALLVELGFMDNRVEAELLRSDGYREECALELDRAICRCFDVPYTTYSKTAIMGTQELTAGQMVAYLLSKNPKPKLNCSPLELAQIFLEEGKLEGIRGDIAWAQALHETGYFNYGGIVVPDMNNYAGIGAVNNSKEGTGGWFKTPRIGVRAQIQHLKGYATTESPSKDIVDPRYQILIDKDLLGGAPHWEDLGGKWAYPGYNRTKFDSFKEAFEKGETYGQTILDMYERVSEIEVVNTQQKSIQEIYKKIVELKEDVEKLLVEEA